MNGLNEFAAKKLGEVAAFARMGNETLKKGRPAFANIMSEDEIKLIEETNDRHERAVYVIAGEYDVTAIVDTKAEATVEKLRAIRDLYVKDQWDNATELAEWSGFFEGAAIVHWSLVEGAGEGSSHQDLAKLAFEAKIHHEERLKKFENFLRNIGVSKTSI